MPFSYHNVHRILVPTRGFIIYPPHGDEGNSTIEAPRLQRHASHCPVLIVRTFNRVRTVLRPMSSRWPRFAPASAERRRGSYSTSPRSGQASRGIQRGLETIQRGGSDIILINEFDYEAESATAVGLSHELPRSPT